MDIYLNEIRQQLESIEDSLSSIVKALAKDCENWTEKEKMFGDNPKVVEAEKSRLIELKNTLRQERLLVLQGFQEEETKRKQKEEVTKRKQEKEETKRKIAQEKEETKRKLAKIILSYISLRF